MTETPNRSVTPRGFDGYDEFTDSYGARSAYGPGGSVRSASVYEVTGKDRDDG